MNDQPNLQPTLRGERLMVRPVTGADWEGLFAAASDPYIWAVHPDADRYQEPVFRRFFDDALASGSAFVIVDTHSGNLIGSSRYHGYDPDARGSRDWLDFSGKRLLGRQFQPRVEDADGQLRANARRYGRLLGR